MQSSERPYLKFTRQRQSVQEYSAAKKNKMESMGLKSMQVFKNREPSQMETPFKKNASKLQENKPKIFQSNGKSVEKSHKNKDKTFRFQLKCIGSECDNDDGKSLYSYGGYSVRSRMNSVVPAHNHKKIKQDTVYDYHQDDIPFIDKYFDTSQDEQKVQKQQQEKFIGDKRNKLSQSPFSPIFVSNSDNLIKRQKQIRFEQGRQNQEIQKFNKMYEEQDQKKALKIRALKTNVKLESDQLKSSAHTRLKQKQLQLSGFEVSKPCQPNHQVKFCYPCKIKYEDYEKHIAMTDHKLNLKKSIGTEFFDEEMEKFHRSQKQQLESNEYKNLEKLANYLQNIADSIEVLLVKKKLEFDKKIQRFLKQVDHFAKKL